MQPEPPRIEVEALTVWRGRRKVLDRVSLEIPHGEPYAIVGESGSGKTTLLYAITGLLPITDGKVAIRGHRVSALSARERAKLFGLVFQDYQLFPHLSVWENVMLAPKLHGNQGAEELAKRLLEELRIDMLASRYPHELSGGQKQRVGIARSLVLEPSVLFFDEPSAALDAKTSDELAWLLREISLLTQVIVVSHDVAFIERCCTRGARIASGRLIREGALEAILGHEPRQPPGPTPIEKQPAPKPEGLCPTCSMGCVNGIPATGTGPDGCPRCGCEERSGIIR